MAGTRRDWMRAGIAIALILGFAIVAVLVHEGMEHQEAEPLSPVQRDEAEAVLAEAVRLGRAGEYQALCERLPDYPHMCEQFLDSARREGWKPGPRPPEVTATRRQEGEPELILELTGTRTDGSRYQTDFEVIRTEEGLVARFPVYWSPVNIVPGEPCAEPAGEHAACMQGVATAPSATPR
ncbi:hypothetical protein [Amycolatopsis aidingensis]|uniref:hypothetical protein n=1 Tax=Amycolatopsis aidingensis TaxID=2842453 RepID=UPI001C0ACACF|nr:hypothetical protein [Amycolatopsis aidingensis]